MAVLAFQMPDKVVMEKADDFHGIFEFKPLEPGYGVTVGNALRRVLLSSLEGYAIIGIKMGSVLHEFSTVEGVVEDVSEIILNLKMLRLKKLVEDESSQKITIQLSGKSELTGKDITDATNEFEVLNPELVICHMDESVELELELFLDKGRGYVPAEENRQVENSASYIPIDAIYTPIKNVTYSIENTRVEQKTDYEKLVMDIQTDGSIHPEDALKGAAHLLMRHLALISDQNITLDYLETQQEEEVDEEFVRMRKQLKTALSEMDLSVRAYNCLKAANIRTLGDLVSLEISDMMKFRNFGKKSLTELEQLVSDLGLTFGLDIVKYKLDED
ncbi:DNA-directed RNA polymerase, alpha subunit [Bernardetia litoralis DSM 6794]|uniref:DNA-directed RNA polymerase subunit alpha n=1 Tax=Bernardetia litoralis (strain ATCC 23117 / DSM 6794 / NBRC 15988 / NCIMB 1366 / Fx l1 / Sio-4) TaxID=880071 RepID=I4AN46_BERLS|nr:DNA-directed RNA polymerase subunit alpha [Bernardetia litoralis]AFM05381.1 DNA-directed RNA polymerase, alpha subunit [Bernardetia litoralis DSM 6794]